MLHASNARMCSPLHASRVRVAVTRASSATPPHDNGPKPAIAPPPITSADTQTPGDKISEWIKSPFDLASFGPRLTVGALSRLSSPNQVIDEFQRVTELLQSPAPLEDKSKLVASELELIATDCLEKGAYLEGDVLRQVKSLLPEEISGQIEIPTPPASAAPSGYEPAVAPLSTSPTPVVTELPDDLNIN